MLQRIVLLGFDEMLRGPIEVALAAHRDRSGEILVAPHLAGVIHAFRDHPPASLLVVDARWRDHDGTAFGAVAHLRRTLPSVAIVMADRSGSVDLVAQATEAGATDFLVLGDNLAERVATLVRKLKVFFDVVTENRNLQRRNAELLASSQSRTLIVGRSPEILRVLEQVRRVAPLPRPVLIVGERGTGKELIAHALHDWSGPPDRPLVSLNCAAFNDALLETELFGREKGAFTGADSAAPGKFELADGGTLFLDEIGHMSKPFQQKILRVVEYGTYARVGGRKELRTTARVVAATNVDLEQRIAEGEFLSDLYDRLAFDVVYVPPLRERKSDIPILADHYLREFAREIPSIGKKRLGRSALERLEAYAFPGNVRELKNIIERAAFRDGDDEISAADLLLAESPSNDLLSSYAEKVATYEKKLLGEALEAEKKNQAAAARRLGLTYHQFRHQLRKHGLL